MNEDIIKEAFAKVKQDIFSLGNEINQFKLELSELKTEIKLISNFIEDLKLKKIESETPTHLQYFQTTPTDIPTLPHAIGGLKPQNMQVSIGNDGVPTDRQTNRQTDQHIENKHKISLDNASELLNSLDNLKKEVRLKFKRLTSQEMLVFSTLYNLEDSGELVDYKQLSNKLKLTESSIRDYILKIINKGIPITKERLNNKRIILHISQDLRKIASLNTILQLREL